MYYSIFKTPERETKQKEQFVEKLKKYKPEDGDGFSEIIKKYKPEDGNDFEKIFEFFLELRDKNIAHRDNKRIEETQEYRVYSAKVPNNLPSKNKTKYKSYINKIKYIYTEPKSMGLFLALIIATIDIHWPEE